MGFISSLFKKPLKTIANVATGALTGGWGGALSAVAGTIADQQAQDAAKAQAANITAAGEKAKAELLAAGKEATSTLKGYAEPVISDYESKVPKYLSQITGGAETAGNRLKSAYNTYGTTLQSLKAPYEEKLVGGAQEYSDTVTSQAEKTGKPATKIMEQAYPEIWAQVKQMISGTPRGSDATRTAHYLNVDKLREAGNVEERKAIAQGEATGAVGRARAEAAAARLGTARNLAEEESIYAQNRQADSERAINSIAGVMGIAQGDVARYQDVLNTSAQKILDAHNFAAQEGLSLDQAAAEAGLSGEEKAALMEYDAQTQAAKLGMSSDQWLTGQKIGLGETIGDYLLRSAGAGATIPVGTTTTAAGITTQAAQDSATGTGAMVGMALEQILGRKPTAKEKQNYADLVAKKKAELEGQYISGKVNIPMAGTSWPSIYTS